MNVPEDYSEIQDFLPPLPTVHFDFKKTQRRHRRHTTPPSGTKGRKVCLWIDESISRCRKSSTPNGDYCKDHEGVYIDNEDMEKRLVRFLCR